MEFINRCNKKYSNFIVIDPELMKINFIGALMCLKSEYCTLSQGVNP